MTKIDAKSTKISFYKERLFSYSQSYVGFSGGLLQPMAYKYIQGNHPYSSSGGFDEKNSFFISAHIKERLARRYNFGFSFSLSYLDVNYYESYFNKIGGSQSSDINLTSFRLHTQLDMELAIIKTHFFFNFGPRVETPVSSYSYNKNHGYSFINGYHEWNSSSEGKFKTNWSLGVYVGLTLEKNITENKILFLRSQISYSLSSSYPTFRTYDFIIGVGIQFFLPNFTIGQKNENSLQSNPTF